MKVILRQPYVLVVAEDKNWCLGRGQIGKNMKINVKGKIDIKKLDNPVVKAEMINNPGIYCPINNQGEHWYDGLVINVDNELFLKYYKNYQGKCEISNLNNWEDLEEYNYVFIKKGQINIELKNEKKL